MSHRYVSWRTVVHKLGHRRYSRMTLCGRDVPNPLNVGPVGFYDHFNESHRTFCKVCKKRDRHKS